MFDFFYKLMWIHLIVFILSISSMILCLKSFWKILVITKKIDLDRKRHEVKGKKKKNLENSDISTPLLLSEIKGKTELGDFDLFDQEKQSLNYWIIIIILGNISQIFGSWLCLVNSDYIILVEYFVGIGCFFSYLNLIKYISKYPNYSSFYNTLNNSLPNIIKFLLSSSVIWGAFVFFAFSLFWRSERFSSLHLSLISLFCLYNGDSVLDIANNLIGAEYGLIGILFFLLFCIVFIA